MSKEAEPKSEIKADDIISAVIQGNSILLANSLKTFQGDINSFINNNRFPDGRTLLDIVFSNDDAKMLKAFVEAKAEIHIMYDKGLPLIDFALQTKKCKIVAYLLKCGEKPNSDLIKTEDHTKRHMSAKCFISDKYLVGKVDDSDSPMLGVIKVENNVGEGDEFSDISSI